MKRPLAALACLHLSAALATAFPGTGTLTLTTPTTAENKLSIKISVSYNGLPLSDTETTSVSGTLDVALDANPNTGAATVFTIRDGNVSMTNMTFDFRVFLIGSVANFSTAGMKGTAFTRVPPGVVTPGAGGGTFDASQHSLRINQGTIKGAITFSDPDTVIDTNFADSPVEGPGTGTGSLAVVPGASTSTHRNCTVTMTLPVDFTQNQDLDGTPVTVTVKGTIKATGTIPVPLNAWIDWKLANNLSASTFSTVPAPGAAPLGLAWAMGLEPGVPVARVMPVMTGGALPSATLVLPVTGTRGPLRLEQSDSLTGNSWQIVPAASISLGQNPLPAGTTGTVTVQWPSPATRRFIRVGAQQP